MPSGAVVTLSALETHLGVRIAAADAARIEETKDVVARHVDRFAFREAPLSWKWDD